MLIHTSCVVGTGSAAAQHVAAVALALGFMAFGDRDLALGLGLEGRGHGLDTCDLVDIAGFRWCNISGCVECRSSLGSSHLAAVVDLLDCGEGTRRLSQWFHADTRTLHSTAASRVRHRSVHLRYYYHCCYCYYYYYCTRLTASFPRQPG